MKYTFDTTLNGTFDSVIEKVKTALGAEGFGVLSEIDMQATMKKKLDKEIRKYVILGACNAPFAYQALQAEGKIGVMLPCNVVVQETAEGVVEVSAVDPVASMQAIENPDLGGVAQQVQEKLRKVISGLA